MTQSIIRRANLPAQDDLVDLVEPDAAKGAPGWAVLLFAAVGGVLGCLAPIIS